MLFVISGSLFHSVSLPSSGNKLASQFQVVSLCSSAVSKMGRLENYLTAPCSFSMKIGGSCPPTDIIGLSVG